MRIARPARALARIGTALCVLLFVASAASFAWHVDVFLGAWHIGLLTGAAHFVHDKMATSGIWPISFSTEPVASIDWHAFDWLPRQTNSSRYQIAILPMWIPLALIAVPTALLWYLNRRRLPPGACRTCRYDLTGNATGICPECGQAIATRAGLSAYQLTSASEPNESGGEL